MNQGNTNKKKAVVLLSGGIDSTTTLAIAMAEGYEVYALSFNYGQRHGNELKSAGDVAMKLGVKKHIVIEFDLREIGGSALTDDIEVPKADEKELKKIKAEVRRDIIPVTYVPARNTIFLSFGLAWAEKIGAEDIFIGVNAIDYSGYPDCRPEFIAAYEKMANLATKVSVEGKMKFRIRTPLIGLDKADIIRKGIGLGVDYSLTWSCYDPIMVPESEKETGRGQGRVKYLPCLKCDSCILRAKGFEEANRPDLYSIRKEIIAMIRRENIDCKKISSKGEAVKKSEDGNRYYDSEVLVIKNEKGREVFNSLVSHFRSHDEKTGMGDVERYPVYAVTFDMFSSGFHYGHWHYFTDIESLSERFDINSMTDDFERFRKDMTSLLR